jgi:hypothetical protein
MVFQSHKLLSFPHFNKQKAALTGVKSDIRFDPACLINSCWIVIEKQFRDKKIMQLSFKLNNFVLV